MDEELSKAVTELITKSIQVVEKGGTFLSDQVPDVVNQLLIWHGVYAAVDCVLAIVLICVACKLIKDVFAIDGWVIESGEGPSKAGTIGIIKIVVSFSSVLYAICMLNLTWLQIWIAPKTWLLEYGKKFIK